MTLRLATWNVNSLKVRLPHLLDWLARARPDVACLQETKTEDRSFPLAEIEAAGYRVVYSGQKTYNGVAILSRAPLAAEQRGIPDFPDDPKRVIAATVNGVRVVLRPTPFKQDEILFRAISPGGTSLASDADFIAAETATAVIARSGLGALSENALQRALAAVEAAQEGHLLGLPLDLLAVDVRAALHAVGEVTGEHVDDAVLDEIFSRFCIGK